MKDLFDELDQFDLVDIDTFDTIDLDPEDKLIYSKQLKFLQLLH